MTRCEVFEKALRDINLVLARYLEPDGPHDAEAAINELLEILDDRHVVWALQGLHVVPPVSNDD